MLCIPLHMYSLYWIAQWLPNMLQSKHYVFESRQTTKTVQENLPVRWTQGLKSQKSKRKRKNLLNYFNSNFKRQSFERKKKIWFACLKVQLFYSNIYIYIYYIYYFDLDLQNWQAAVLYSNNNNNDSCGITALRLSLQ